MGKASSHKSQSAMEYLMTYGWAILIIAVVLGALFQLGVFNAGTFAPRAPPGACQVFRPNGPNTASLVNLEGVCSGELPQYVSMFVSGSSITMPVVPQFESGMTALTVAMWVNPSVAQGGILGDITSWYNQNGASNGFQFILEPVGQGVVLDVGVGNTIGSMSEYKMSTLLPMNSWDFAAFTYAANGNVIIYQDGQYGTGGAYVGTMAGSPDTVIAGPSSWNRGYWLYTGGMANIQIYNTSLSANEIQYLYTEGIGGAPLSPQYLIGWWPLNGNTNDYSGNDNNGVPSAVTYTNQWTGAYTPP